MEAAFTVRSLGWSFVFLFSVAALGFAVYSGTLVVPNRWNPWAPLKIEEPLHWLTRLKLARLSGDPALCLATLSQAEMRYTPVPDRDDANECGYTNAVRIEATTARVSEPFILSCRSAVALALWERHVVQPAAQARFGEPVSRLQHFGSYACRNVYGRKDAPLSRHATADAFDASAFVLAGGRSIRVDRDWGSSDADGAFLREIRDGACRVFDAVLGPEYNAAHRNHFHLDRGGFRLCR